MNARRVVATLLIAAGIVVLFWGGVFWKDRDTVVDAGPLQIATVQQKGISLPPAAGVVCIVAGLVLLLVPLGRKA
jgi:hypothetical protein